MSNINQPFLCTIIGVLLCIIIVLCIPIIHGCRKLDEFNKWTSRIQSTHLRETPTEEGITERCLSLDRLWDHLGRSGVLNKLIVDWGTMLSAVHENGLFKGDYDIDLWCEGNSYHTVLNHLKSYFTPLEDYSIHTFRFDYQPLTDERIFIVDRKTGVYADITSKRRYDHTLHRGYYPSIAHTRIGVWSLAKPARPMNSKDVYPCNIWEYRGFVVNIPKNAVELCLTHYGPYNTSKTPLHNTIPPYTHAQLTNTTAKYPRLKIH